MVIFKRSKSKSKDKYQSFDPKMNVINIREKSMEYKTESHFQNPKFNKTITKFNLKEQKISNAKKQFMLTQMGFLKKKYTTPDYEDVGFPIKRDKQKGLGFNFPDDRIHENMRIMERERHRSKETLKKKMLRKDRSLGKKDQNQNTPSHKRKKGKYKKKR